RQHIGPILALGAARAGMDFEVAVVSVGLARKESIHLAARDLGLQLAQSFLGLGDDLAVVLGLGKLDQRKAVVEFLLDAADRAELILERGALLHQALGALIVIPEVWVFGELVQLGQSPSRIVDVKDASSAVRSTA